MVDTLEETASQLEAQLKEHKMVKSEGIRMRPSSQEWEFQIREQGIKESEKDLAAREAAFEVAKKTPLFKRPFMLFNNIVIDLDGLSGEVSRFESGAVRTRIGSFTNTAYIDDNTWNSLLIELGATKAPQRDEELEEAKKARDAAIKARDEVQDKLIDAQVKVAEKNEEVVALQTAVAQLKAELARSGMSLVEGGPEGSLALVPYSVGELSVSDTTQEPNQEEKDSRSWWRKHFSDDLKKTPLT